MFGRRNTKARKLNAYEVQLIRKAYEEGATQGELARAYAMSVGQIGRIVRGESWTTGAGDRAASPRELDETLQRMLTLQAEVDSSPPTPPAPAAPLPPAPLIPPSLLEGGDAADETQGSGTKTMLEKAKEFGVGETK